MQNVEDTQNTDLYLVELLHELCETVCYKAATTHQN